jgi:integrase
MADEVTSQDFERYALKRRKADYANASTNRIFQCLRRAFNLAGTPWPKFELLDEKDNVREGVFKPEEMQKVLDHLPDDGLRDYVAFAYSTGMRKGEISALRWSFHRGDSIVVPAGVCKNRRPHMVPVAGPLAAILKRREAARSFQSNGVTQLSEYIFHRGDGQPITEFRKSWRTACTKAGCGNRIFHDLRRTSISDMVAAQVPQSVCMAISGHKTISVFLRYAISSDDSKSEALKKRRVSTTLRQVVTKFSEFFICWVSHKEISRQDRLATAIANVVDPRHPRFFLPQAHFAFPI